MTNNEIVQDLLQREGGYTAGDPETGDPPTNFGITQKTYDEWRAEAGWASRDVKDLDQEEACQIYEHWYIFRPGFADVADDYLRWLLVDSGVNNGRERTIRWLQAILGTAVDGVIGPLTLARLRSTPAATVYYRLCETRMIAYADLVAQKHALVKYVAGWIRRVGFFVGGRPA
jgi:lysozyme family protein